MTKLTWNDHLPSGVEVKNHTLFADGKKTGITVEYNENQASTKPYMVIEDGIQVFSATTRKKAQVVAERGYRRRSGPWISR